MGKARVEELVREAAALRRQGRGAEALERARAAFAADPQHPRAARALGVAALELGAWDDALRGLRAALRAQPEPALRLDLAVALREAGQPEPALEELRLAERALPEHPVLLTQLGATLRVLGRAAEARGPLRRALAAAPGAVEPRLELAAVELALGELAAAEALLRGALAQERDHPDVALALGRLLARRGRPAEGARVLAGACLAHDRQPLWVALADLLAQGTPPALPRGVLLRLLEQPEVDVQRAERALCAALPQDDTGLAQDPLLPPLLRRCLVLDPALERRLRGLRARLLGAVARGEPAPLPLVEALALHAWHTEHAWACTPEEDAAAEALAASAPGLDEPQRLAAWLMVRSPLALPPAQVAALLAPGWEARPLAELLRHSLVADQEERALAAALPALTPVRAPTSAEVRARYEAHPYPRLISVHRLQPAPLRTLLAERFPWVPPARWPTGPLQVLLAGCGAGQQVLAAATRYADAQILGVDLSRRSLGRAARRARAHGLGHVTLAQADLLELGALDRRFALIECGGVLHHLAEPLAGWRVLRGLLAPGGLMKIGLYSARARADIDAARALADALGLGPDPAGLRALRDHLQALPEEHPARPVVRSPDFASLSGLADLLFHPCEHRFTPAQLGPLLAALDLELLGFQHPDGRAEALYRERWPDDPRQVDLERWDTLEQEHPRLFTGMLVFWAQAPAQ